ncbi:hypothetical protein K0M31_004312 [Melipona bicolor]|uniref:Uncharacterized protein n=1 Tax=Melipona bicolor TaxID=60889 RepID=A0AA40FWJ2_9HYME|nr:hypothetical protein K0M31_004312 [Melipona bicolor]
MAAREHHRHRAAAIVVAFALLPLIARDCGPKQRGRHLSKADRLAPVRPLRTHGRKVHLARSRLSANNNPTSKGLSGLSGRVQGNRGNVTLHRSLDVLRSTNLRLVDKPVILGDAFTRFVLALCHDFDITLFRRTRREIWIAPLNILSSVKCGVNMAPGYAGC